jgi:hypothetical protein
VAFLLAGDLVERVHTVLDHGSLHTSPGGQYSYRVLGPCCRLFDREELPWPCCRLAWRSKEPSWRRIGRRFVPDLAARRCPSYAVELLQPGSRPTITVLTLFPQRLSQDLQEWWYSKLPSSLVPGNQQPPIAPKKRAPTGGPGTEIATSGSGNRSQDVPIGSDGSVLHK